MSAILRDVELVQARRVAIVVGGAGIVAAAIGGALSGADAFFRAWLVSVLLWLGIPVGCLAIAFMHQLSGGEWGAVIERVLEAAARTIPWLALAFLPLLFHLSGLYTWTQPGAAADPRLAHKSPYLNLPFFVARAIVYFATWTVLAWLLDRWSTARDATGDPRVTVRLRGLAAVGLIALGLTVSFAAIDWIMSLEATWYSTVFGGMVGIGWMLAAYAFVIAVVSMASTHPPFLERLSSKVRIDLGNLLLTFVILWTYLAFVQLLICWSGNIPEEVSWYVHRFNGGWDAVAAFLGAGRFLLPLFVLLSRAVKQNTAAMSALSVFLLLTQWVDTVWLVLPAWHPNGFALHWLDVVAPIGLGGLWVGGFLTLLARRPLVARFDPALTAMEVDHAA